MISIIISVSSSWSSGFRVLCICFSYGSQPSSVSRILRIHVLIPSLILSSVINVIHFKVLHSFSYCFWFQPLILLFRTAVFSYCFRCSVNFRTLFVQFQLLFSGSYTFGISCCFPDFKVSLQFSGFKTLNHPFLRSFSPHGLRHCIQYRLSAPNVSVEPVDIININIHDV